MLRQQVNFDVNVGFKQFVIVVDRGRLCSNESFMTVNREQHSVMCCNLLFYLLM